jgi:hypothetical protein
MSDDIRLTITLRFGEGDETQGPKIIDVTPAFAPPPKLALPPPRPWWRSKTPNMLDGAVFAGTFATVWWLFS